MSDVTTLKVTRVLHDELAKLATKGESFEDLLWRFVDSPRKQMVEVEKQLDKVELKNRREEAVIANAKERLPKLEAQATVISNSLTKVQSEIKLLEGQPDQIEKLAEKKQLEQQLLKETQNVSLDLRLRKGEIANEPEVQESIRRLALVRKALQNLPKCKDCGTETVLPAGVAQPQFPEVNLQEKGWRRKQFSMILDLACAKCGKRFGFTLEKGSGESKSKAKAKPAGRSRIVHGPYNKNQGETEDIRS